MLIPRIVTFLFTYTIAKAVSPKERGRMKLLNGNYS